MAVTLPERLGLESRVHAVDLPDAPRRRLFELGVRPGATVCAEQCTAGGGLVVRIEGARIALDGRTARTITVDEVP